MRVAAAQLAPAFMQRDATLDKVLDALGEAAANGAQLVAFPETFVPGYPAWADFTNASTFDDSDQKAAYSMYLDQSVDIARGDLDTVVAVAAQLGVFVYLGVAERSESGGSIYCSLVAIDPTVGIVGVHRKLKPTFGERMMWAEGPQIHIATWPGSPETSGDISRFVAKEGRVFVVSAGAVPPRDPFEGSEPTL